MRATFAFAAVAAACAGSPAEEPDAGAEPDGVPEETAIYATTVGVSLAQFSHPDYELRVAAGDPGASALHYRMNVDSNVGNDRMPPLATDAVDETGVSAVAAWIESL